jgi:tRNA (mo5U34)-methyltransferase
MTLQSQGHPGQDAVSREISALAPWFHNLHLPTGHETAPDHPLGDYPAFKWDVLAPHLPADLSGWTALDIGCNAGYFSFQLAERGAEVVAIDHDEHYLRQARWAAQQLGVDGAVSFDRMSVYDLARSERRFDLILFMGVLYHLRYPLLALDLLARRVERLLVVQTLTVPDEEPDPQPRDVSFEARAALLEPGWPRLAFVERRLAGDPTNWWLPNRSGIDAMIRSAGLRILERPDAELAVCAPGEQPLHVRRELQDVLRTV